VPDVRTRGLRGVPILVVAGVLTESGRVLVTKRPSGAHLEGLWEFPGGKVEPGEAPESALVRELEEELGITVRVDGILDVIQHAYPEKTVRLLFYDCTRTAGEPRDLGVAGHRWVAPAELRDEDFPPADARLLAKLRART
jgi:8-oxo-dGTP diphosphatase